MKVTNIAEYALFRGFIGVLRFLPRGMARRLLLGLGKMAARTRLGRGDVVRSQLEAHLLGEGPAGEGLRDVEFRRDLVYYHLALTILETFTGDPGENLRTVQVRPGWQSLDAALAQGKGAILASGHLGNFELAGAVVARRYPLLDVVKTQRNPWFDRYLETMRQGHGIATVSVPRSTRAVLRHLRDGGVVSLLLDQDAGPAGMMIDFLGRPASTWPGAARLSLRTGCPVVPVGMVRQPDGGHHFHVGEALRPEDYCDSPEGVRAYLQDISSSFEVHVRAHPEQWFWVHRRWKNGKEAGSDED